MPLPLRAAWTAPLLGLDAVHPQHRMVDEQYMAWAKRKGYRVNAWTVNDPDDVRRCLDLGVDSIITDRPDLALAIRDGSWA
jgi:glycerophosphoryl diester phosphodiesterase